MGNLTSKELDAQRLIAQAANFLDNAATLLEETEPQPNTMPARIANAVGGLSVAAQSLVDIMA